MTDVAAGVLIVFECEEMTAGAVRSFTLDSRRLAMTLSSMPSCAINGSILRVTEGKGRHF